MATPKKKGKRKGRRNGPGAGAKGLKGSRESTLFFAAVAAEEVAKNAMDNGMNTVTVHIKGPGSGREAALRSLQAAGLKINYIRDVTPIPHHGCRPPTRRREGKKQNGITGGNSLARYPEAVG